MCKFNLYFLNLIMNDDMDEFAFRYHNCLVNCEFSNV